MSTDVETRRVVEDRFPANVRTPDGHLIDAPCRVVLTRDEIYVYAEQHAQVELVHQGPWLPELSEIMRRRAWRVAVPDQPGHWTIERRGGCRCGALARFVPWTPYLPGRL